MIKINENLEFDITLNDTKVISDIENIDNELGNMGKSISVVEQELKILTQKSQLAFSIIANGLNNLNKDIGIVTKSYENLGEVISKIPKGLTKITTTVQNSTNKVNKSIKSSSDHLSDLVTILKNTGKDLLFISSVISAYKNITGLRTLAGGLKNVTKAADDTDGSFTILGKCIKRLRQAFKNLKDDSDDSGDSINKTGNESKETSEQVNELDEKIKDATGTTKKYSNETENATNKVEELSKGTDEVKNSTEEFSNSATKATSKIDNLRISSDKMTVSSNELTKGINNTGYKFNFADTMASYLLLRLSGLSETFRLLESILNVNPFSKWIDSIPRVLGLLGGVVGTLYEIVQVIETIGSSGLSLGGILGGALEGGADEGIIGGLLDFAPFLMLSKISSLKRFSDNKRAEEFAELYSSFMPQQLINHNVDIRNLESNFSQSFNIEKIIDIAANKISKAIDKSNEVRYIQTQINVNDKEIANLTQKPLNNMNGQNNILENRLRGIM